MCRRASPHRAVAPNQTLQQTAGACRFFSVQAHSAPAAAELGRSPAKVVCPGVLEGESTPNTHRFCQLEQLAHTELSQHLF
jgi:hypothetical protein